MPETRSLQYPNGQWEDFARKLLTLFDRPIAEASVEAADQAAMTRRVTVQVRDRIRKAWPGRWVVRVYVAAVAGGPPVNTQTVAVVAGTTLVQAITANSVYDLMTDAMGVAQLDVTLGAAGTRVVVPMVLGKGVESGALAWT